MSEEEDDWIESNAPRVAEVLARPETQQELYELLGGPPDPKREREALAAEVARLRLTVKRSRRS